MSHSDVPDISVDEIITKIRADIAQKKQFGPDKSQPDGSFTESVHSSVSFNNIRSLIANAQANADAGATVTPMERFSGPKQKLALFVGNIIVYLASFITDKQRRFNYLIINSLQAITDNLDRMNGAVWQRDDQTKHELAAIREQLVALNNEHLERLGAELNETRKVVERISAELLETKVFAERLGGELLEAKTTYNDIQKVSSKIHQFKLNNLEQQSRLTMLLEEERKRLQQPLKDELTATMLNEDLHILDDFYVAFEDHFRGTRDEIKERLKIYIPFLKKVKGPTGDAPILDVGCGRGEWLELLQDEGLNGQGIDINRVMVGQCRERGFEAMEADVIAYLHSLPDASMGAITGFHIIEHLSFKTLITLFDETLRVLRPGGVAIFETPNPQNILVGSCNFYFDPTHRNPLPSPFTQFLMKNRGFNDVEIMHLNSSTAEVISESTETAKRFNSLFYGPMDYATIGWRL